MKKRLCHNNNCEIELSFDNFRLTNNAIYSKESLTEMWNSKYLHFFCCDCFEEEEMKAAKKLIKYIEKMEKTIEEMKIWQDATARVDRLGIEMADYLIHIVHFFEILGEDRGKSLLEMEKEDVYEEIDRYFNGDLFFQEVLDYLNANVKSPSSQ